MSVVVALIKDNVVAMAADRREVDTNTNKITSEICCKMISYGYNVAIGAAGNSWACQYLLRELRKLQDNSSRKERNAMTTTQMALLINQLMDEIRQHSNYSENCYFCVMIAGKTANNILEIKITDNVENSRWDIMPPILGKWRRGILAPSDVPFETCDSILASLTLSNADAHPIDIVQDFVTEIHKLSAVVGKPDLPWCCKIDSP